MPQAQKHERMNARTYDNWQPITDNRKSVAVGRKLQEASNEHTNTRTYERTKTENW